MYVVDIFLDDISSTSSSEAQTHDVQQTSGDSVHLCSTCVVNIFLCFKDENVVPLPFRPEDGRKPGVEISDPITLSQVVAEIMDVSTSPSGKYFDPPPEARFISNRNVSTRGEAPTASVTSSRQAMGPFDVDLDSTTEPSNLSAAPFTFVSGYIGAGS